VDILLIMNINSNQINSDLKLVFNQFFKLFDKYRHHLNDVLIKCKCDENNENRLSFKDLENQQIISSIDYFPDEKNNQCHIYSYPYQRWNTSRTRLRRLSNCKYRITRYR